LEFLDENGIPVLSMRHRSGSVLEDYNFSTGGNSDIYREWEFVEKVLQNQEDPLGDKYSGYVQADWGDYFYVSGPVFSDENKFVGVILVGATLEGMTARIREKSLGQVTFYKFDGTPIASSLPFFPTSMDADTATRVLATQDQPKSKTRILETQRDINIVDIPYTEVLAAWEIRGDRDIGILGSALQKNFFVSSSPATRFQVMLLVGLALLLIILVGISLSNLITRPLLGLVKVSKEVSEGNLNVRAEMETNDEINTLVQSFNQMIANLSQSRDEILQAYDSALLGWMKALELRDKETEGHTERVTDMAVTLAGRLGITGEDLVNVRRGAILHDIGKMGIPDKILHKPGPLNDEEWEIMRKHPIHAYNMLSGIQFLKPALDIPQYHHENWDGKGYPYGLKGEQIPISARIFSVVDTWDALRSERPYKAELSREESMRILEEDTGSKYDPEIVEAFKILIAEYDKWFA
jgi:putative nucleotidyltransferase with HDIG domain